VRKARPSGRAFVFLIDPLARMRIRPDADFASDERRSDCGGKRGPRKRGPTMTQGHRAGAVAFGRRRVGGMQRRFFDRILL
jgi:hypothetical protein